MATMTQRLAVIDQISNEAADVRVGKALAVAFTAIFIAVGWVVGRTVYGLAFSAKAVRYGYRQGAKIRRMPSEPQRTASGDGLNKV